MNKVRNKTNNIYNNQGIICQSLMLSLPYKTYSPKMLQFLQSSSSRSSLTVFSHANTVSIGQCCRYTISVIIPATTAPSKLLLSLKNLELEAKKILNVFGISVYCQLIPCNFNQTLSKCPIPDDPYLIQVIQDVLPNEEFTAILNFNENSKYSNIKNANIENADHGIEYRWNLDVLSQVILINSQIIRYSLKISLPEKDSNNTNNASIGLHNHDKTDFTLIVGIRTSDQLWNKDAPNPEMPSHLILLTHGIYSNAHCDMLYLKEQLEKDARSSNIMIRGFQGNVGHTEKGIRFLGTNLANYIDMLINTFPKIEKISFIGHSLGGVTQSFAIFYLLNYAGFSTGDVQYIKPVKIYNKLKGKDDLIYNPIPATTKRRKLLKDLTPMNFVTLASPMLGTQYEFDSWINLGLEVGYLGKTGKDLALRNRFFSTPLIPESSTRTDEDNSGSSRIFSRPILEEIPLDVKFHYFMKRFKQRICFANIMNDGIVPLKTSSLLYLDYSSLKVVDQLKLLRKENERENQIQMKASKDATQNSGKGNIFITHNNNQTDSVDDNDNNSSTSTVYPSDKNSIKTHDNHSILAIPPPIHSPQIPESLRNDNKEELRNNSHSIYSSCINAEPSSSTCSLTFPKKAHTSPNVPFFKNSMGYASPSPASPNFQDSPNSSSFMSFALTSPMKSANTGLKSTITTTTSSLLQRTSSTSISLGSATSLNISAGRRKSKVNKKKLQKLQRIQVRNNNLNYSLFESGNRHNNISEQGESEINSIDDRLDSVSLNDLENNDNNDNNSQLEKSHVVSQDDENKEETRMEQTGLNSTDSEDNNLISIPPKSSSIISAINVIRAPTPEKSFFKNFQNLSAKDMQQILKVLYENLLWNYNQNNQRQNDKTSKLFKTYLKNMLENGVVVHDKVYSYDELPPAYYNKTSYSFEKKHIYEEFLQECGNYSKHDLSEKAKLGKSVPLNFQIDGEKQREKEIENEDIPFLYRSKKSNFFSKRHVKSKQLSEKIARLYSFEKTWRKVLVTLKPDAHNNIIVRRQFVNSYGWNVISYLVDIFEF